MFRSKASFYGQVLSTPHPTSRLEDHPLSAVHDSLFNIFTATLYIGGHSSIHNLTMRHAVVTGTHLSRFKMPNCWSWFSFLSTATVVGYLSPVRAVGSRTGFKMNTCASCLKSKIPLVGGKSGLRSSSEALPAVYPVVVRGFCVGKRCICNSTRNVNDWPVCVLVNRFLKIALMCWMWQLNIPPMRVCPLLCQKEDEL